MALPVTLSIVAAVAENGVIGHCGRLPWRIPNDLRRFREITMGKPLIMGRRTFESIGRPLPGRTNIVVSRRFDFSPEGVIVMPGHEAAIARARVLARGAGVDEMMIIGGADLYRDCLPMAHRIYLTEVHATVEGDVLFPEHNARHWNEISRSRQAAGRDDAYAHSFVILERRPAFEASRPG